MATRALRFCNHAGCKRLISETYCEEHAPLHAVYADRRGRSDERGYDSAWQRARALYLRRHPLCERCIEKDRVRIASMVHHIIPISEGGSRLDPDNFKAMCRDCHEIIHGRKLEG